MTCLPPVRFLTDTALTTNAAALSTNAAALLSNHPIHSGLFNHSLFNHSLFNNRFYSPPAKPLSCVRLVETIPLLHAQSLQAQSVCPHRPHGRCGSITAVMQSFFKCSGTELALMAPPLRCSLTLPTGIPPGQDAIWQQAS